jgi:ABC-type glutathione transport system ATPase component
MQHLLEVKNLQTHFPTRAGLVRAVDGVSFHVGEGELLGLVGESGCGKSMTALSVMRLVGGAGKIAGGEVWFAGENLLEASEERMREIRGDDIAMIFQDPMTSLNPVYTVGEQIAEALRLHRRMSRAEAREATVKARLLQVVSRRAQPRQLGADQEPPRGAQISDAGIPQAHPRPAGKVACQRHRLRAGLGRELGHQLHRRPRQPQRRESYNGRPPAR